MDNEDQEFPLETKSKEREDDDEVEASLLGSPFDAEEPESEKDPCQSVDDVQSPSEEAAAVADIVYQNKKPKWWVQRSGRASKAQRKAMREMESFKLIRPPYGELIDWSSVFLQDNNSHNNSGGSSSSSSSSSSGNESSLDVWLEIGFGGGENLLRLAEQYHGIRYFVGAEIHPGGIGKACRRMQEAIQKKRFWTDYKLYIAEKESAVQNLGDEAISVEGATVENPYYNLRVHRGDGVKLLLHIPSGSLSAILITNPDPFPKKGEEELRLIQTGTIRELRRCLRPNGRLYLGTDHEGYFQWSLQIVDRVNEKGDEPIFRRIEPCPQRQDWLPVVSNYEQKGWDAGRTTFLACWEAVARA